MHGTVMIFLGVVPLLTGAFGNYLVPLRIGAKRQRRQRVLDANSFVIGQAWHVLVPEVSASR
jgi:heme/copper-type cytochrome/quinol oxidase subunit 1